MHAIIINATPLTGCRPGKKIDTDSIDARPTETDMTATIIPALANKRFFLDIGYDNNVSKSPFSKLAARLNESNSGIAKAIIYAEIEIIVVNEYSAPLSARFV
jgi:hypothetical protein